MKKNDFKAYDVVRDMLDETINECKHEENLMNEMNTNNFGILNHIFENELPTLIKTNKKGVKNVIKTIKEDKNLMGEFNFYNVHYARHHVVGTSGSTVEDMCDIVRLISEKRINPAVMITHIGGIDAAIDTTLRLPKIPGGKKLIYTHIHLPLTQINDFKKLGETDERFAVLAQIVEKNNGLWCAEAEKYLLENW